MNSHYKKNYFFITTYDNISANIINILINSHPSFQCQLNPQSTLFPAISAKPIQDYINSGNKDFFAGDIKSFTALSLNEAKYQENIQDDMIVVNITMPITLRVKLLLHNWLNLGFSDEQIYQQLKNELTQPPIINLLNQYNFDPFFKLLTKKTSVNIADNIWPISVDLTSERAKIFHAALALAISADEMDNRVAKQNIDFESMLQDPDYFFNTLHTLSGSQVIITTENKEKIISLIKQIQKIVYDINQSEFLPWQNELINWYSNSELKNKLRFITIRSSFLTLVQALNVLKNDIHNKPFAILNNQFFLKNSNIYYEVILLEAPNQMRDRKFILPQSVLQNINNPNVRFLYDLSIEAVSFGEGNLEDWLTMHRLLEEAGVPSHKVYFICSNCNVRKHYLTWLNQHNIQYRFNVFGMHYWPIRRMYELMNNAEFQEIRLHLIDVAKKTVENNIYRPYYFMCLNLKTRIIRTALLLFLLQRNYFSKGIITYLGRFDLTADHIKIYEKKDQFFNPCEIDQFFNQLPEGKLFLQYFDQLDKMTPIVYDVKADEKFDQYWPLKQLIPELGKYGKVEQFESYFEIVTETFFLSDQTLNLTEKTVKPILRFQMFIIVGSPHTLSSLREMGFQTFSPYIDETYDTITDPAQRFIHILKEIDRLCNLSIDELHKLYCALWPRILHNYNRMTQDGYEVITGETNKLLQELQKM